MCPVAKVSSLIGRPRDAARDHAIRTAAVSLMQQVGYDRTTMDEIAARAKVSKATVYRRWPNKRELIADVVHQLGEKKIFDIDTGSLRGDLIELISAHVSLLKGEEGALVMGLMTGAQSDPELSKLLMDCKPAEHDPQLIEMHKRAMARNEISPTANVALIAEVVPAILMHRLLVTHQSVNKKFIEQLVDGLLIPALSYSK